MAIELIDIGNIANDGTGDDLRTAFEKVNLNFVELDTNIDASIIGSNVGNGVGIFKQKVDNTLEFRTLDSGNNLSVSVVGNKVVINTNFEDKDITVGSLEVAGNGVGAPTTITQNNITTGTVNASSFIGSFIGTVYPPGPSRLVGIGSIEGFNPAYGTVGYEPARVDGDGDPRAGKRALALAQDRRREEHGAERLSAPCPIWPVGAKPPRAPGIGGRVEPIRIVAVLSPRLGPAPGHVFGPEGVVGGIHG
jgi:hypothetical protein